MVVNFDRKIQQSLIVRVLTAYARIIVTNLGLHNMSL